jgi:hypothetical protein
VTHQVKLERKDVEVGVTLIVETILFQFFEVTGLASYVQKYDKPTVVH